MVIRNLTCIICPHHYNKTAFNPLLLSSLSQSFEYRVRSGSMTSQSHTRDRDIENSTLAQLSQSIYPVTALAFVHTDTAILLLAGEGPWLRIYDAESARHIHTSKLTSSEPTHAIKARTFPGTSHKGSFVRVLAVAGYSFILLDIASHKGCGGQLELSVTSLVKARADDWILDICFYSRGSVDHQANFAEAVLVTSHNSLLSLHVGGKGFNFASNATFHCLTCGPRSLLFSAHIAWLPHARGLVAAGTVFGEVLVYSFPATVLHEAVPHTVPSQLHYVFKGHGGSVFGVQISEYGSSTVARRFVASCSDDRTIRVWDVTDLGTHVARHEIQEHSTSFDSQLEERDFEGMTNLCVATAMGHTSRIWGIVFLETQPDSCHVLSYSEDATAQVWRLRRPAASLDISSKETSLQLQHISIYGFHFGKNIWAIAVLQSTSLGFRISTGGADGRIVTYQIECSDTPSEEGSWQRQYQIRDVSAQLAIRSQHASLSAAKRLFVSLKGSWRLLRHLHSAIPTYPSGILEGTAIFQERASTDPMYDLEYLYTENGQLVTQQGFTLSASRRYVYRFQEPTEQISAWFVKPEGGATVDYLFHVLSLEDSISKLFGPGASGTSEQATASGYHLCINDDYHVRYSFNANRANLSSWGVKYTVKGPNKDYIADSKLSRDYLESSERASTDSEATGTADQISTALNTASRSAGSGSATTDSFKTYTWINQEIFLTTTANGCLLLGTITHGESPSDSVLVLWDRIGQYDDLKGTCLTASVSDTNMVLLTGKSGTLYLYKHGSKSLELIIRLPRKVACLQASLCRNEVARQFGKSGTSCVLVFASCLGSATAYCLFLDTEAAELKCRQSQVNLPKAFLTTSAHFAVRNGVLLLGSRSGDIVIYSIEQGNRESAQFVQRLHKRHVHGEDTITTIQSLPSQTPGISRNSFYILTTGRDGKYGLHTISLPNPQHPDSNPTLQTVHISVPPFGPNIEGAYFSPTTTDLLLWGFRSKDFVVWNETQQQETLTVECGGAHRNWAYTPLRDGSGGGRFIWTKASTLNVRSQVGASHRVVRPGGHGREIKAVAVSPVGDGERGRYMATGAEDTDIRIFRHKHGGEGADDGLKCLHTLSKHITGVQQLRWSSDGHFLFSAAGREEFFVWRVQPVPCFGIGVVCVAQCPGVTEAGDLRVMDFEVLEVCGAVTERYILPLVYSDSTVRVGILGGFCRARLTII